jgi:hypothetical protein
VREAVRLQRGVRWAAELLGEHEVELPKVNATQANAEVVAAQIRAMLGVTVAEQRDAATDSAMFKIWRRALEDLGIVVVALSLGPECSRGFSAWDGLAPLIAMNTQWNTAARIFTLFHEVGHLVSRTNSVCDEHVSRTASDTLVFGRRAHGDRPELSRNLTRGFESLPPPPALLELFTETERLYHEAGHELVVATWTLDVNRFTFSDHFE